MLAMLMISESKFGDGKPDYAGGRRTEDVARSDAFFGMSTGGSSVPTLYMPVLLVVLGIKGGVGPV